MIKSYKDFAETENWLLFAFECKYIKRSTLDALMKELDQIGKMLNTLHKNWKSYAN